MGKRKCPRCRSCLVTINLNSRVYYFCDIICDTIYYIIPGGKLKKVGDETRRKITQVVSERKI